MSKDQKIIKARVGLLELGMWVQAFGLCAFRRKLGQCLWHLQICRALGVKW